MFKQRSRFINFYLAKLEASWPITTLIVLLALGSLWSWSADRDMHDTERVAARYDQLQLLSDSADTLLQQYLMTPSLQTEQRLHAAASELLSLAVVLHLPMLHNSGSLRDLHLLLSQFSFGVGPRVDLAQAQRATIESIAITMMHSLRSAFEPVLREQQSHLSRQLMMVQFSTLSTGALALGLLGYCTLPFYRQRLRPVPSQSEDKGESADVAVTALADPLTALGNHRAFQEALPSQVQLSIQEDASISLVLLDIVDFRMLNEQHGHAYGDQLLATLGSLLKREQQYGSYRVGADVFALICPSCSEALALATAQHLRAQAPELLGGATLSVGLSCLSAHSIDDATRLREEAEAALREAKLRGRDKAICFSQISQTTELLSSAQVHAVRRLIAEEQVQVVFQPIWDIEQRAIMAFEALIRPSPEYGIGGPAQAFDIAERIGRVHELDGVCRRAILRRARELPPRTLLFLNLSPQSLGHDSLEGEALVKLVREAGLSPDRLVLEITERSLMRLDEVIREAWRLRSYGFRFALDDVGSGNAGLELLRQIPVDFLKIDRSIVSAASSDSTAASVLAALIAFARTSGTFIIAEGIEDVETLNYIRHAVFEAHHQHYGVQGYLLGRPSATLPVQGTATEHHAYVTRLMRYSA